MRLEAFHRLRPTLGMVPLERAANEAVHKLVLEFEHKRSRDAEDAGLCEPQLTRMLAYALFYQFFAVKRAPEEYGHGNIRSGRATHRYSTHSTSEKSPTLVKPRPPLAY